jgi:hypothetical protein
VLERRLGHATAADEQACSAQQASHKAPCCGGVIPPVTRIAPHAATVLRATASVAVVCAVVPMGATGKQPNRAGNKGSGETGKSA